MYAFYSLLIYIFYSLFRRDGAAARPGDAAQDTRCKPGDRRRADQSTAELWSELSGLVGCPEPSKDAPGAGAESQPAQVSLEEALVRLAEFLSVHLEAEEGCRNAPDLSKPSDLPPLLTVTGQLLALLAWIRSPRWRQQSAPGSQAPTPTVDGPLAQEDSPRPCRPRDEAQEQLALQVEQEQRARQRLEELILGQLEELKRQLDVQEEELDQLRLGMGATDSEKRVQHLTLENEALKQSLSLTRDLLLHCGPDSAPKNPQEEAETLVELQDRLQDARDTTEALQVQLQQEMDQGCRPELQQVHGQLAELQARMASLRQGCRDLRGLVSTFTQSWQGSLSEAQGQVSWALKTLSAGRVNTQLHPAEQQRPSPGCPGRLLELKGNIRVLCRLKPGVPSGLVSTEPGPGGTISICFRGRQRRFCLDWVFPADTTQEEVFRELEPTVLSCLGGYNVCIFTYGQTGTGKTYSMEGPPEDPGIAPRALQALFREMGTKGAHRVTLSMVEIYNEAVRDLLAPGPPERLTVRQGPAGQGEIQVAGLTYWDVPNLETLHQMLSLGKSNRATAATAMNQRSSRSHALVTLTLRGTAPPRGPGTAGTLHLVDLAGSERAWKADAMRPAREDREGAQRLREARTINRSLLALGGVMAALRARRRHVPYRDSQLTRLLQPALGPGATAVLLLQISTRQEDLGETVCSLKFAERVGRVELGPARRRRATGSGTPSSLSTDTALTGTPRTPTPCPGSSPPSPVPDPDSGPSSARARPEDLPA